MDEGRDMKFTLMDGTMLNKPSKASLPSDLENYIMNPNIPKTEEAYWASKEIKRLRDELSIANKRLKSVEHILKFNQWEDDEND